MIAEHKRSDLGAADLGAEFDSHVSATCAPFVANSFNLSAKIHGAGTYYLGVTVHDAELRVHFLKSFQKGCSCENLSTKGSGKKDGEINCRRKISSVSLLLFLRSRQLS
jgi:hypothetical protein